MWKLVRLVIELNSNLFSPVTIHSLDLFFYLLSISSFFLTKRKNPEHYFPVCYNIIWFIEAYTMHARKQWRDTFGRRMKDIIFLSWNCKPMCCWVGDKERICQ